MNDLIDRQATIDLWEKYHPTIAVDAMQYDEELRQLPSAQPEITLESAIDYLHSIGWMQNHDRILTESAQRWIPCGERMPEEDCETGTRIQYSDFVLMTVYNAEDEETIIDYGYTVNGEWYSDTTDCFTPPTWKVVAWMPLPEPYRKENADE